MGKVASLKKKRQRDDREWRKFVRSVRHQLQRLNADQVSRHPQIGKKTPTQKSKKRRRGAIQEKSGLMMAEYIRPRMEITCEKCGKIRSWPRLKRYPALCRRCSYASRKVERIKLTCVGYKPYGGAFIFAKRCPGERAFLPAQVKIWTRQCDDEGQPVFIDLNRHVYRCRYCAGAVRMIRASESFVRKMRPNALRIRNLSELKKEQSLLANKYFKNRQPRHPGPYEVSPGAAYARDGGVERNYPDMSAAFAGFAETSCLRTRTVR